MSSSDVRLRSLISSEEPLQMLPPLQIDRKCAPLPGGVANTAQRKMLGKRKKGRQEFPFLLPPLVVCLFI